MPGPRPTTEAERSTTGPDPQSRLVVLATVLLAGYAVWRVRIGVDFGDGAHVVALAVRMAQGDLPFADEMNVQVLGSVPAVPFTWVWLKLVGEEGIVLASRLWYVVLATAAGGVAYRALRTRFRPLVCFVAVAVALVPTPYNLWVTSYNTIPALALLVATTAGYAAVVRVSAGWAAVCGGALALAVFAHPSSLPGAALLGVLVVALSRRRPVVTGLVGAGGGASALVLSWLLLVPGWDALVRTYRFTIDYQSLRAGPGQRLADAVDRYADVLLGWPYLPMYAAAVVAVLPGLPGRVRALALATVPVAAAVASLRLFVILETPQRVGSTSGTLAVVAALGLTVPVAVWALRSRDSHLLVLLALALPPAAVGVTAYAMTTSAASYWGASTPPAAAAFGVLVLAALTVLGRHAPTPVVAIAGLTVLALVLGVQSLRSFRDAQPWTADQRIDAGPHAGLRTNACYLRGDREIGGAVTEWVRPGDTLLAHGSPAAYLYADAPMDTNIIWLSHFGQANRQGLQWFDRTGRSPDVVLVATAHVRMAGGWEPLLGQDPLLAHLASTHGPPVASGPYAVLRRDGAGAPGASFDPAALERALADQQPDPSRERCAAD